MRLFDEVARIETRPRREREPTFQYWNLSARESVDALRRTVEAWFDRFPDEAKKDLRARFRSPTDSQHEAAFWEIYLHELFTGMGYKLEAHPVLPDSSNHPDYLVQDGRKPCFYLEATVAGLQSTENAGAEARLREVFDLVNKLVDPNFFLEVHHKGFPNTPPPVRGLRAELEQWLKTLDVDSIRSMWRSSDFESMPTFQWTHGGLTLAFSPIPRSTDMSSGRAIAITAGEPHQLTADEDIRASVEGKANKYGELSLPIVIAVNFIGDHCDETDINNALFGSEAIRVIERSDGKHEWAPVGRKPNGAWFGKRGPRNQNLSAVLIANQINPYTAGTTTPILFHNPYTKSPLNLSRYPLPQSVPDKANRTMQKIGGRSATEFIRLPSPWPPAPD